MSNLGIFTLIIVGGIVWGGFIIFLIKAVKNEKNKNPDE